MEMRLGHFAGITVYLQQVSVLKEIAGVPNAYRGRYAAFASEGGCVLKNRAFLDDQSGDPREQWRKMWMEDA
jgi:hypothetical protein